MSELLSGEGYANALIWTLAALAVLLLVLFAVRRMRGLNTGSLIPGGRGRMARLGVVEATVVDNQRRLLLVRRDNVEHLILIGGPSDLVVEQQIQHPQAKQTPKAPTRQTPASPERSSAPSVAPEAPAQPTAPRPQAPSPAPKPAERQEPRLVDTPPREAPAAGQVSTRPAQEQAGPARDPARQENEEEAMLKHVDLSISEIKNAASPERPEESIDDEMSRLLNDISENKNRR